MTCLVCLDQAACDGAGPPGCWHRMARGDMPPGNLVFIAERGDFPIIHDCGDDWPENWRFSGMDYSDGRDRAVIHEMIELRGDAPEGAGDLPPVDPPRQSTLAGARAPAIFPKVNEMALPPNPVLAAFRQAMSDLQAAGEAYVAQNPDDNSGAGNRRTWLGDLNVVLANNLTPLLNSVQAHSPTIAT